MNENFCIDIQSSGRDNGTNIWLYENNGTDAQKYKLISSIDGAINYALKYSTIRNSKYKFYNGNNCANF